jgi:hypothetical protein
VTIRTILPELWTHPVWLMVLGQLFPWIGWPVTPLGFRQLFLLAQLRA